MTIVSGQTANIETGLVVRILSLRRMNVKPREEWRGVKVIELSKFWHSHGKRKTNGKEV